MSVECLDLADFLLIAEQITGISAGRADTAAGRRGQARGIRKAL